MQEFKGKTMVLMGVPREKGGSRENQSFMRIYEF